MIEADQADYNRAKLDHDLIVATTTMDHHKQCSQPSGFQGLSDRAWPDCRYLQAFE